MIDDIRSSRCAQDILEDTFLRHEVDMVMSGHVHLYARTCSVKHDRCKKPGRGGITHVTVGAHPSDCLISLFARFYSLTCTCLLSAWVGSWPLMYCKHSAEVANRILGRVSVRC